jgi:hypothetical protein
LNEAHAAFLAAAAEYFASIGGCHARAKADFSDAFDFGRLVSLFHFPFLVLIALLL